MCVPGTTRKPIVYVGSSNDYFNISGTLFIDSIKFTGINQFVISNSATQNLGIYPVSLCSMLYEPYGNNQEYVFNTSLSGLNSFLNYSCGDKLFTFPNYRPT